MKHAYKNNGSYSGPVCFRAYELMVAPREIRGSQDSKISVGRYMLKNKSIHMKGRRDIRKFFPMSKDLHLLGFSDSL